VKKRDRDVREPESGTLARRALLGTAAAGAVAAVATSRPQAAEAAEAATTVSVAELPEGARTRAIVTTEAEKTKQFGTYAQSEMVVNVRDLYLASDGTVAFPGTTSAVPNYTRAMARALAVAGATGSLATIGFPSGSFVMEPFVVNRPIRIVSFGSDTSNHGTATVGPPASTAANAAKVYGGTQIWRAGSSTAPLMTVNAAGVSIEGISFNGSGRAGGGILVKYGFELRMFQVRVINALGVGLQIDRANNALFHHVMIDRCGVAGQSSSVVINSADLEGESAPYARTNTLDIMGLTIEQNRHTALEIGVDASRNVAARDQAPEYLRITDLHIESASASSEKEFLPNVPVVAIGVVTSLTFVDPFIYGGPAPLIRQEEPTTRPNRSEGVTVIGGTLRGQYPADGVSKTLVELVRGNYFKMLGVRLLQYGPNDSPVVIQQGFRDSALVDSTTELPTRLGVPPIADRRGVLVSPSLQSIHGKLRAMDHIIAAQPSGVVVRPAGANVTDRIAVNGANDSRGKIIFVTSGSPAAGMQLKIWLSRRYTTGLPVAIMAATDERSAAARPYLIVRDDASSTWIEVYFALAPPANATMGINYIVMG